MGHLIVIFMIAARYGLWRGLLLDGRSRNRTDFIPCHQDITLILGDAKMNFPK